MSGTPFEVTCTCTDENFILTDNTLAAAPADPAVWIHDNGTGIHKDINQALF